MMDQGQPASDPISMVNNCVGVGIEELDTYTSEQRQAYEAAFASCQNLAGCAFETCFHP